jgi:hypothetical protein
MIVQQRRRRRERKMLIVGEMLMRDLLLSCLPLRWGRDFRKEHNLDSGMPRDRMDLDIEKRGGFRQLARNVR